MQTKIATLRAAWASGDRIAALRIASKFSQLGTHADAIRRGWDAHQSPDFYRQIKKDPAAMVAAGIAALADRYQLETK